MTAEIFTLSAYRGQVPSAQPDNEARRPAVRPGAAAAARELATAARALSESLSSLGAHAAGIADRALKIRGAATALTAGTTNMCGTLDRLTRIPRSHIG